MRDVSKEVEGTFPTLTFFPSTNLAILIRTLDKVLYDVSRETKGIRVFHLCNRHEAIVAWIDRDNSPRGYSINWKESFEINMEDRRSRRAPGLR